MALLDGQVAVVTGASRGIGRGIAVELAREGASVALAARTLSPSAPPRIDGNGIEVGGSLGEAVEEIVSEGGVAAAFACDLSREAAIEKLIKDVVERFGRLDILVNNGQPQQTLTGRFWELPPEVFDEHMAIGPRSYYLAARFAAPIMISQKSGMIVGISAPGSCIDTFGAAYCTARAASDRITQALARDLAGTGVRSYSIWPSFIRTERLMMAAEGKPVGFGVPSGFDPATQANSPEMVGRAIAHLAADSEEADRNGTVLTLAELSEKYGFSDTDGRPAMRHKFVENSIRQFGRVVPPVFAKIEK